jgi:hypothetical protein
MPSKQDYDAVFSRLRALTDLIEQEARESLGFFEGLQKILLSEEVVISADKPLARRKAPILHVLSILHERGESALREELERLTNDQLARLAADEGIKRLKDAKATERKELQDALFEIAQNRLKQGESFTRLPSNG